MKYGVVNFYQKTTVKSAKRRNLQKGVYNVNVVCYNLDTNLHKEICYDLV